jgi:hypothetical protein
MTAPEGPAIVTLREAYDLVLSVKQEVAGQNVPDIRIDVSDHEARIRSPEKWVWRVSGFAALGGAGLSLVVQDLLKSADLGLP